MKEIAHTKTEEIFLACDFGGGSGRVMAGWQQNGHIQLQEVHRFQNRQIMLGNTLYWDFPALFQDMKDGLRKAASLYGSRIRSIGIDTWGVDFGIVDGNGDLVGLPVCYRDKRTQGLVDRYFENRDRHEHYQHNGTQVMEINTLFQLLSLKERGQLPPAERNARLLFMPDLFSFYLTGVANNEYTIASTSQLLNARSKDWDWTLIDDAGLPRSLFQEIVMPGTSRGVLLPEIADELGLDRTVEVVAVASHDTASAVMSMPAFDVPTAWISSGTWSLLGATVNAPILTAQACDAEFTNEGGANGTVTFLSNITGLWIMQQLAKEWGTSDWSALIAQARDCEKVPLIDVDSPAFTAPESMQQAINEAIGCSLNVGQTTRCVLASLAHRYAVAIRQLNELLPQPVEQLHIIGGGSQNQLLNELTAQSTGLSVTTGDTEATAIGNILCQVHINTN